MSDSKRGHNSSSKGFVKTPKTKPVSPTTKLITKAILEEFNDNKLPPLEDNTYEKLENAKERIQKITVIQETLASLAQTYANERRIRANPKRVDEQWRELAVSVAIAGIPNNFKKWQDAYEELTLLMGRTESSEKIEIIYEITGWNDGDMRVGVDCKNGRWYQISSEWKPLVAQIMPLIQAWGPQEGGGSEDLLARSDMLTAVAKALADSDPYNSLQKENAMSEVEKVKRSIQRSKERIIYLTELGERQTRTEINHLWEEYKVEVKKDLWALKPDIGYKFEISVEKDSLGYLEDRLREEIKKEKDPVAYKEVQRLRYIASISCKDGGTNCNFFCPIHS